MIRLENVSIRCGEIGITSRVSLEIGPGEAAAVIGRSASGKTALVKTIAGLTKPQAGRVVHRVPAGSTEDQVLLRVGFAPADSADWPVMRADEFLEMVGLSAGLTGKPLRLAVARGLGFASCETLADRRLDSLSDGQRKRLLLAAPLLHDPDLLVLDDPMRCLDRDGRTDVEQVVTDLALAGGSVIAALNDGLIGHCWTRVILIEDGRLFDTKAVGEQPADCWPSWSLEPLAAWRREAAR